ncbi:MAG: ASCH domain-containing protein [Candidatus Paceibacterota bacterium]|jgi:hypothetical protein
MKTLKFRPELASLILLGEKTSTWRLFDDKNLTLGDEIILINKSTGEEFGKAVIIELREKKLGEIIDTDFYGHEKFESVEKMYEAYRKYYGDKVTPESIVKIIKFRLV